MNLDLSHVENVSWSREVLEITSLGSNLDMYVETTGIPFIDLEDGVIGVTDFSYDISVNSIPRVNFSGFIMPGRGYKLVATRCHLCFAPLVKEGSERERDLKTGTWLERATGEYSCGTVVVFEPNKKLAVTPGAKVRVGSKCVKLLKKK